MTIVANDPMTGQPMTTMLSPMANTSRALDMSTVMSGNPYESAANVVEHFLNSDSVFPQMIETFKVTQSICHLFNN